MNNIGSQPRYANMTKPIAGNTEPVRMKYENDFNSRQYGISYLYRYSKHQL